MTPTDERIADALEDIAYQLRAIFWLLCAVGGFIAGAWFAG